jgi:hypothetical protein
MNRGTDMIRTLAALLAQEAGFRVKLAKESGATADQAWFS